MLTSPAALVVSVTMAESKGEKRQAARREAQPIPWEELTPQQRSAAMQACRILSDIAAQELPRSDADPGSKTAGLKHFLPAIDRKRLNHVVLLDGSRGTGKTALLITLLDLWNRRLLQEVAGKGPPQDEHKERRELLETTARVVPVGLIDLQPLPPSTNLLLHLVGQFLRVVEALEMQGRSEAQDRRSRTRAPWHDVEAEEPPATRAWKDFLRAAAMGWDGSLPERRAALDPEAYALELEQAERRRLDVRRCFRELVDALVREFPALVGWPDERQPLFVVPIDDADMNPERTVELLDLLRTLWHPRVAFLLTGHSKLFLTVLRAQSLATLRAPLRELKSFSAEDISRITGLEPAELARNVYDKVIPEAHRCRVPAMSPDERLGFLKGSEVLTHLPALKHPLGIEHLEEYFSIQWQAQWILPDKLRSLTDFVVGIEARLHDIERIDQESNISPGFRAQERKRKVSYEIHQELVNLALIGANEWGEESGVQIGTIKTLGSARRERWRFRPETADRMRVEGRTFRVLLTPVFEMYPTAPELPTEAARAMHAAYVALFDANLEGAAPRIGLHHFVVWREIEVHSRGLTLCVSWPLPDWECPLDYAAFFTLWAHVVSMEQNRHWAMSFLSDVGAFARLYLSAVLAFVDLRRMRMLEVDQGRLPSLSESFRSLADSIRNESTTWSALAARVRELAGGPSSETTMAAIEWARRRAGLLAAPESGLEVEAANEWLKELVNAFGAGWDEMRSWLHSEQRHRIIIAAGAQKIVDSDADALIDELDDSASGYAWREDVLLQGHAVGDEIAQLAGQVGAVSPDPSRRVSLGMYLSAGRLKRIVDAAPLALLRRWRDRIAGWGGTKGTAQRLVVALWDDAASMGQVPRIDAITGKADLKALRTFYDTLNNPWEWCAEQPVVDIGPSLRIAHVSCVWREDLWRDQPLAKPLFELVWDVLHDTNDLMELPAHGDVCWWDGVGGRRDTPNAWLPVYPWPFVSWQSFIDTQIFALFWAQVRGTAVRASDLAPHDASVAVDLAMWYVTFINDVVMQGDFRERPWQSGIDPQHLAHTIGGYGNPEYQNGFRGQRWAAFAKWCRALPILAAPESGLTPEAAEAILAKLQPTDEQAAALRKLRRDRMMYRKPPRLHVEPWLRAIDDEDPSHPWVSLIERRK